MQTTGALSVRSPSPNFPRNTAELTGAFVAAPFGGLLWGFGACGLRLATLYIVARVRGHRFDALDKPIPSIQPVDPEDREAEHVFERADDKAIYGKFF